MKRIWKHENFLSAAYWLLRFEIAVFVPVAPPKSKLLVFVFQLICKKLTIILHVGYNWQGDRAEFTGNVTA